MRLPTFEEAEDIPEERQNPLEEFVYHYEPAGPDDFLFRLRLESLIHFIEENLRIRKS